MSEQGDGAGSAHLGFPGVAMIHGEVDTLASALDRLHESFAQARARNSAVTVVQCFAT